MRRQLIKIIKTSGLFPLALRMLQIHSWVTREKTIKNYLETHIDRKLHIGCGSNILDGWLNTDLFPRAKEIVYLDATKRFPLNDDSFSYVFSEHIIEHIEYTHGLNMLRECFRILKPGGMIRISTPSLSFLVELYQPEKNEVQNQYIDWAAQSFAPDIIKHKEVFVINNFFYNFDHKFIYDMNILQDAMAAAGFVDLIPCAVGESKIHEMQGLESHSNLISEEFNKLETFVIEGKKPE